jgi:hypothetical protein
MANTYTGGCACGAIRYEVSDEAVFQNHCQCAVVQSRVWGMQSSPVPA